MGTSVARESSDLILLDDNFATIVRGVKAGRVIFANIQKSVLFLLRTNFAEICLLVIAVFSTAPIPLLPVHLLFLNLLTDSFPALALAAEPAEKGTMRRPPRPVKNGFLDKNLFSIFLLGFLAAVISFGVFVFSLSKMSPNAAKTLTLTTMVFIEIFLLFSLRRDELLFSFQKTRAKNKWIFRAAFLALFLFFLALFSPISHFLKLELFPIKFWIFPVLAAAAMIFFSETRKYFFQK